MLVQAERYAGRSRHVSTRLLVLTAMTLALLASACRSDDRPSLDVAAAADLRDAFEELTPMFEQRCDCEVSLTFGSSGLFATQIREGLPVDVFFSANEAYVQALAAERLVQPESVQLYAIGRIVIATARGAGDPPATLDGLLDPSIRHIALPNPDHAPYGVAGKQALESAGLWEAVSPKLVFGENAAQTTDFVETRSADVGILPLSLTIQRQERLGYALIDDGLYHPLRQAAAVLSRSGEPHLAADFIAFVNGQEGRVVMRKYGFLLPEEAPEPQP